MLHGSSICVKMLGSASTGPNQAGLLRPKKKPARLPHLGPFSKTNLKPTWISIPTPAGLIRALVMGSRSPPPAPLSLSRIPNWLAHWDKVCFGLLVYNRRPKDNVIAGNGIAGISGPYWAELMTTKDPALKPEEEKGLLRPGLAVIQSLRIRQWVKNGLVFLPFLFAVNQVWAPDDLSAAPQALLHLARVFLGFCALSSAVYLLNDLADREEDRRHPTKRHRAIASGQLPVPGAVVLLLMMVAVGLVLMGLNRPLLVGMGLLYLAINLTYSLGAKRLVLVDVMLVASGYVIRAAAGALAINVSPSPWLYAVTAAGALFIVLGRRYAEVRLAGDDMAAQRPVLLAYRGQLIGQLMGIAATAALVSYTLYTVEASGLPDNNSMLLTAPLVTLGLFRYLYLLNTSEEAEYPERLIVRDLPLVVSILCWIAVSTLVLVLNSWPG